MSDKYISAIGGTDDAEAASGDGTMIALLKRLRSLLASGLPLDDAGGLTVITWPHHQIHEGNMYMATYKTKEGFELADNANIVLSVGTVNDRLTNMAFGVSLPGTAEIKIWEGAGGVSGTLLDNFNMNRHAYLTDGTMSAAEVQHVIGVTVTGTLIQESFLAWSVAGGGNAAGDLNRINMEWILHTGTTYLIEMVNRVGTAQPAGMVLQWYEVPVP